jgi:hypothetical protein
MPLGADSEISRDGGVEHDGRQDGAFGLSARLEAGEPTPYHGEEKGPDQESQPRGLQDQPDAQK